MSKIRAAMSAATVAAGVLTILAAVIFVPGCARRGTRSDPLGRPGGEIVDR